MDFSRHIKPLTGETDCLMWKRKISDQLDYQEEAIEVIDSKLKRPESIDADAQESVRKQHKECCNLYRKANSYAKSLIASAITDAVYQKIMDKETAFEAWESLKQQFEATSKDQLFKICAESFAFSWVPGEDVTTHIAKLRSLWNELNNGLVKLARKNFAAQDRNQNNEFVSTPTECWLKVKDDVVLYGSRSVNGFLIKTNIEPILPKEMTEVYTVVADISFLHLYHEKWGFQDKRHIRNMLEKELGIRIKLNKELCEPCIFGKAHRILFGTRKKAFEPSELISADV
ncbi:integrase catalytic domain-containing protein [Trichonephila inaurata madagascariensis]|uniref:Integrase catalytic domain-containing protein n=1 Tax=Trichonephila inaurata madagascariensis TaxID=2747483 RepID=A0A8X6X9T7_9ARAC|nr:integrase catalytic domain-containing protein [Trichonephila inaurata madagascariensis]